MADGGSDYEQSSVDGAMRQSLDSHLLECPICLEQLRQPKSLPCLHSFCLECLGSYITKELSGKMASASSFSCPVCRKVTEPMNQSEFKESWAEQFPTNNLAVEILQQLQKTDKSITCKPCETKGNKNVPAKFWCKHNNAYFCTDCKINVHDLLHGECEPQDISEVNMSALLQQKASLTGCGKHKEKMEYYCEDHQILGCNKCIIVDHRKCEVVTSAEDYRDKLRKSSNIDDLLEELRKSAVAMEILIKDVGEQLKTMTLDQDTALQSLTDIRKQIDERFDVLQKDLTDKLISAFKEEKENLEILRQQCERLMFSMQNTLMSSKDAALKEDIVGTINLFQRGQAEVKSCKELVKELERSSRSTSIKHKYDPDILSVGNNTSLTMGKIVVDQQPRRLPSTVYSNIVPLSERHLKMTGKFSIKVPSDKSEYSAYGVVLLSGGRIVVADKENRKMKLFTEKGDFKFELELTDASCDLCRIDDNTVAAILIDVKTICIVNVGDSTLTVSSKIKIPKLDESCLGVTYHNNYFIVGTTESLYSVPASGGEPKNLLTFKSQCLHLASNQKNGHVFASIHTSTPDEVVVIRLSDEAHTHVLKVGLVKSTTGIDVDREGNLYVCGSSSNNVIQMSGDGRNIRELLTSSDGIKRPRAISVWEDRIVITNGSKYQNNFVHMFQLVWMIGHPDKV
ncbi:tripartite motif-containing protein 2-like isoform X1 [Mizuhopecten yessoensis]|uniref:Tripartite motif-containing protein 2 n=1 Tax=Mizuhopecten yessoensis TaxID=6573 RepID=A0A210QZU6_MIZYE|nr:tripartite motif-containing protein 2-like isoform X1 [Mizuhopecten yessoensis]XP_021345649.1 tripartite motif-containing protein 2-like isoform X1 [Mizuhopecten yessoensis]XP_021345650.1 tripartite motif-containing protein 2-like isoform X1 [Mizuhopecten yessoensis]OWF54247.1 Tripartite motif-containing protein 2 [Mizuhopecten yessoensis]